MKFLNLVRKAPLSAQLGLLLCAAFTLVAALAHWIAPFDSAAIVGDVWMPISAKHWLGTDNLGRDLMSRLIQGTQTTLVIAGLATILSFTLGSVAGFVASVAGGWVDMALSRAVDVLMAIPTLIFALVVLSVFPSTVPVLILVMGILDSTRVYRLARAVAMDINVMDFVEAARLRGEKTSGTAGSLTPTFVSARLIGLAVKHPSTFTLYA